MSPPAPASSGEAAAQDGELQAGAGGVFSPLPPSTIQPGRPDPVPSGGVTAHTTPQTQAPGSCPPAFALAVATPGSPVRRVSFYPWFTRNGAGGYDGRDSTFAYDLAGAIPPGGDPGQTQLGAPATAANMAGHVIAVDLVINPPQQQEFPTGGQPLADYGQTCGGLVYGFTNPYLAGDDPPPPPPAPTLDHPPFALGASLLATVTGRWRIGTVATLPGPGGTARTFVHIPTCAWLDSGVPATATQMHAVTTATSAGYTLFLVYTLTVTPGAVQWDWGDGTSTTTLGAATTAPPGLPVYDASTQTWTNPCSVSHAYATVAAGRTITATQTFDVGITVSWSDGIAAHTARVACDTQTRGDCSLALGPAQGWQSGPHPVDQIEPIPFQPNTPSPNQ